MPDAGETKRMSDMVYAQRITSSSVAACKLEEGFLGDLTCEVLRSIRQEENSLRSKLSAILTNQPVKMRYKESMPP